MKRLKEYTVALEVKKLVNLQINIVAESGQVNRLREYIIGYEVKKLVTLQIHIVVELGLQVR